MTLQAISLTGADDGVDPAALRAISQQFPLVEWAILSSSKRQGSARFPGEDWVTRFHAACPDVRKAIHLCEKDVDAFLAMDERVHRKVCLFDRVQLNFNHRRQPKDLDVLVRVANSVKPTVIIQHHNGNKDLWPLLQGKIDGLSMLFDSSGGGGRSPKDGWPTMLEGAMCGYAGGLGPDNINAEFATIANIAAGRKFWIDMEGKLRSPVDDSFSLEACAAVLAHVTTRTCSQFI